MSATATPTRPDLEKLPAPLAVPYSEALGITNPQVRFRLLIKAFAGLLHYSALLVLVDYLRLRKTGRVEAPALDAFVADNLERPSPHSPSRSSQQVSFQVLARGDSGGAPLELGALSYVGPEMPRHTQQAKSGWDGQIQVLAASLDRLKNRPPQGLPGGTA